MFLWHPSLLIAAGSVGVASVGYAASLGQQELLVTLTPRRLAGQVLGAESSARIACQGLAAALAGAIAEVVPAGLVITILSLCSVAVSIFITPGLRRAARSTTRTPLLASALH